MAKGLGSFLLPMAAIGATVMSGGTAAPALAGAASGAGAAGATGAGLTGAGLGLAGDTLAAQGAAGLLGGAGAAAAGYGMPALGAAGLGAAELGGAASELPAGMATYGPNNEYVGSTIANDGMSANSFTGGYDKLNPFERVGQRLSSIDMNGKGMSVAKQGLGMMQGGGEPQPQSQSGGVAAPMQRPQQQAGSFVDSSNMSPLELEEMKKRSWLQNLGNPNA